MKILLSGKSALTVSHPSHAHETWEIIANYEGKGFYVFDGERIPYDENTVVCIPPSVSHFKVSDTGFRDVWVQFSEFPSFDKTKPTFLTEDSDRAITSLLDILYLVRHKQEPNAGVISDLLLESVQQMILSRLNRQKVDPRAEEIANSIVRHFQDPAFSLDDCLANSGYCPDHMRRLFREEYGKTPHEYLTELRIRSAKKLLSARNLSNYSVTAVCMMVGFSDVSYFSRIFKKHTGLTPSEYFEKN